MAGKRNSHAADLEFFARCAGGFEDVLAAELRGLRMRRVRPQVGGVIFFGSLSDAYRACLWLRSATRVQLVLARVAAADADELYRGVADLPWERHVADGATIAVDAHGENPALRNTKFVALKAKDAICDRLREARGTRPNVDTRDPDLSVNLAVHPSKATVYLNLSGASLHRRGYRQEGVQTEAPLKETLAAGILLAAGWAELAAGGACLADPMCGSGTFSVEAALIAANIAPGLLRTRWGFEGWCGHSPELWERVCEDARHQRRALDGVRVVAGDLNPRAVEVARENLRRAGVEELVSLKVDDAANLRRRLRELRGRRDAGGLLVANPPYGKRLLSGADLPEVNKALAAALDALPAGWKTALVTPDPSVDTALGLVPAQTIACYNGPIRVWVRIYDAGTQRQVLDVASLGGKAHKVPIAEQNSAQFAARLRKVAKERGKWARKSGVASYRVYDADLPDYALSVDLYQGCGADEGVRALVIREHRRPASIDELRAGRRLADAAALSAALLDVSAERVVVQPWLRSREERDSEAPIPPMPMTIAEGSCSYEVDLAHRVDDLPMSQRSVRALAGTLANGGRVAALFATSAPALAQAVANGVQRAVVVDGSKLWLASARQLLETNGFVGKAHQYACADVRQWLADEVRARHTYSLVLCVAPLWLSARDAGGAPWDLAKEHAELLEGASRLLAPGGMLLLAFDAPDIRLDLDALRAKGFEVTDASGRVVPHDFERSRERPRCFLVRRP